MLSDDYDGADDDGGLDVGDPHTRAESTEQSNARSLTHARCARVHFMRSPCYVIPQCRPQFLWRSSLYARARFSALRVWSVCVSITCMHVGKLTNDVLLCRVGCGCLGGNSSLLPTHSVLALSCMLTSSQSDYCARPNERVEWCFMVVVKMRGGGLW